MKMLRENMDICRWNKFSSVVALAVLIISAVSCNWITFIAALISISVLIYSERVASILFAKNLYVMLDVSLVILGILSLVGLSQINGMLCIGIISVIDVATIIIRPIAVFIAGMMIAVVVDHVTESTLSKRWMIMLAVGLAFAVSVCDMFSVALDILLTGQPFGPESPGPFHDSNMRLMISCDCSSFVILASAIVCRHLLKGVNKERLREVSE